MNVRIGLLGSVAVLVTAGLVSADVTGVTIESAITSPLAGSAGYVVNDFYISFVGQLTSAQMFSSGLLPGDIYQDAYGGDTAPNGAFFGLVPSLAYDSFVHFGGKSTTDSNSVNTGIIGGAIEIGGAPTPHTFTNGSIDIAWNVGGGTNVSNRNDFFTARITLLDTASGVIKFAPRAGAGAGQLYLTEFVVVNGVVGGVPEPASLAGLTVLVGLCAVGGHRRRGERG
jgi:hypothetical protein